MKRVKHKENFNRTNISDSYRSNSGKFAIKDNITVEIVAQTIIAFASILGNILVLLVFYKYSKVRKRVNIFIAALSLSDLMTGLTALLNISIKLQPELQKNYHICILKFTCIMIPVSCSISFIFREY